MAESVRKSHYGSTPPAETLIERLRLYFPVFFDTPEGEQAIQKLQERREREQQLLTIGSKGRKSFGNGL